MSFDVNTVRTKFPALSQEIDGKRPIFLDNPAGTQVPQQVIDAVVHYFSYINANQGGAFATSKATDDMQHEARQIMRDLFVAPRVEEIVFGPSMTALNFNLSRAIAKTLPKDSEIVVTRMDHDANIAPWLTIAEDNNWTVRWVDFDPELGTLDLNSLEAAVNEKTKIVAAVHASNALGTINPVAHIADVAHSVGAYFVMDAVQSAPHVPIDVQKIGCDFLLCSAYKFFGPHIGVMWGKYDLLQSLPAYKVRPSKDVTPYRWENGTPSFETIAATAEAIRYLETFKGDNPPMIEGYGGRQLHLKQAFTNLQAYETELAKQLITGLQKINGVTIAGVTDLDKMDQRVATVAFVKEGHTPQAIVEKLAEQQIFAWAGNYYAVEVMERLGREDTGMVRVGAVHYNTAEEIDTFLNVIDNL
ncbi:MAG: cysteine desulfurase-like protein [Phototrophicaceae bacterium]